MAAPRLIICPRCRQQRPVHARGLCASCYRTALDAGEFGEYLVDTRRKAPKPIGTDWAADGLCTLISDWNPRRSDGWPGMTDDQKRATCVHCPVQAQCRSYGLEHGPASEVTGGLVRSSQGTT